MLALLGGALIKRGVTGHCEMYAALGINSRQLNTETGVPGNKGIKVVKSVTVGRPAQEVYRYWRKLENLAQFMNHVKSVTQIDERRSNWVVKGPMGTRSRMDRADPDRSRRRADLVGIAPGRGSAECRLSSF